MCFIVKIFRNETQKKWGRGGIRITIENAKEKCGATFVQVFSQPIILQFPLHSEENSLEFRLDMIAFYFVLYFFVFFSIKKTCTTNEKKNVKIITVASCIAPSRSNAEPK